MVERENYEIVQVDSEEKQKRRAIQRRQAEENNPTFLSQADDLFDSVLSKAEGIYRRNPDLESVAVSNFAVKEHDIPLRSGFFRPKIVYERITEVSTPQVVLKRRRNG